MFSEDQLEQLRSFPDIGRDDLIWFFTLTVADVAFVDPGRGLSGVTRAPARAYEAFAAVRAGATLVVTKLAGFAYSTGVAKVKGTLRSKTTRTPPDGTTQHRRALRLRRGQPRRPRLRNTSVSAPVSTACANRQRARQISLSAPDNTTPDPRVGNSQRLPTTSRSHEGLVRGFESQVRPEPTITQSPRPCSFGDRRDVQHSPCTEARLRGASGGRGRGWRQRRRRCQCR